MKQTLRNLIADGKTKQALDQLRQLHGADTDLSAEVVQLAARFSQYERQHRMGVEDPSVLGIELRKINSALMSVIDKLQNVVEVQNLDDVNTTDTKQPFSWTKWTGINDLKSWIAVAAGIAGIMTFYFKYCGQETGSDQFKGVSVTVENKEKNLIPALLKAANVFMVVEGGETKHQLIDEQGKAAFQNVKVGDKVRLRVAFSEPYCPLNPDSLYTVPKDGHIILTVGLQNLGQVYGRVFWQDEPLKGVLVAVEDLRDTTDDLGRFSIQIPVAKQRQKQEVIFKKDGFKTDIKPYFPQTNVPLNWTMTKK